MVQNANNFKVNRFDYQYLPVNDLQVVTKEDPKTGKAIVDHVLVQDEPVKASQRFWTSLFARYGFNKSFFRYYSHAEVFQRISDVESNDRMRLCIERGTKTTPLGSEATSTLMAVSNPTKPLVVHDELTEMLAKYDSQSITYANGIVESTHTPRAGGSRFEILGDKFENRFVMQTPIDGYGQPNIYLSMLRMACMNGMVGYSKAFRSSLALGKGADDVTPSMTRALEGFNNDEGFAAIRQRVESAGQSWLSVYESQQLYKLIIKLHTDKQLDVNDTHVVKGTRMAGYLQSDRTVRSGESTAHVGSPIVTAFHKMAGDPSEAYGLANLDSLSAKRQRTLPVRCKVYDAINFATEVATHYAAPKGARQLQGWVGTTITDEYDMEGTADKFTEFEDFLIDAKLKTGLTGSENAGSLSMN
jgi:hypothetical protein